MFKNIDDMGNLTGNSYILKGSKLETKTNSFINFLSADLIICFHNLVLKIDLAGDDLK